MAVLFWYLVRRDLCTLVYFMICWTVAYTEKVTFYKVPEQHWPPCSTDLSKWMNKQKLSTLTGIISINKIQC